eukprot:gene26131-31552_t
MLENGKSVKSPEMAKNASYKDHKPREAQFAEIFLLDMGILLSGVTTSWNAGLEGGLVTALISLGIMTIGYMCLTAVLAELTSITNFAGGVYGYSRCSLGPKYGWIFACSEFLQYNFFTIANVEGITKALTTGFRTHGNYEPLWMLLTYAAAMAILLYLVSSMITCDFIYAVPLEDRQDNYMNNGATGFFQFFMYGAWFYLGIECVTVAGSKIGNGTQMIPKVMIVSMVIMALLAFWMMSVVYFGFNPRHANHLLYSDTFPLTMGFSDHLFISEHAAALIMLRH